MGNNTTKSEAYISQQRDMMFREINRYISIYLFDDEIDRVYTRRNKLEDASIVYVAREIYTFNQHNDVILSLIKPEELFSVLNMDEKIEAVVRPYIRNKKIVECALGLARKYNDEDLKEYILEYDFNSYRDSSRGESYTPLSVVKLAYKILDINKGETVIDTTSGECNFLLYSFLNEKNANYYGQEINEDYINISVLRASVLGCDLTIEKNDIFKSFLDVNADKIFSNHSFRTKIRRNDFISNECSKLTDGKIRGVRPDDDEWLIAALMLNRLNENGKAVGIFRGESLFSSIDGIRDKSLKKYFVDNGFIESVIALPPRMFVHTNIDTFMVVFSKNNQTINFVDATEFNGVSSRYSLTKLTNEEINEIVNLIGKSTNRSSINLIEDVVKKEYDLTPFMYATKHFKSLDFVELGDVCKEIVRGDQVKSAYFDEFVVKDKKEKHTGISFLEQGDIQQGYIYQDNIDDIYYLRVVPEKKERFLTTDCCVILPRVITGDNTKLASIDNDDEKYYIRGHLVAINLDREKINPNYLAALLISEEGQKIIKTATTGNAIHTLSVSRLKHMDIPLLSMKEQTLIGNEFRKMANESKELLIRSNKIDEKMSRLYDERLSVRGEASDCKTVTNRIKEVNQPHGGYLPTSSFNVTKLDDEELYQTDDENIKGPNIKFCVDNLVRFQLTNNKMTSFKYAFKGACDLDEVSDNGTYVEEFKKQLDEVVGLDDDSIIAAFKLSQFECAYRVNPETYLKVSNKDVVPNDCLIHNIRIMVNRCLKFLKEFGPVVKIGFEFDGAYTSKINKGDGGFLTEEAIFDIRTNLSSINKDMTLQILIYYIMGLHTGQKEFKSINKIGIINPRLNEAYWISIYDIDDSIIKDIESDVIGY